MVECSICAQSDWCDGGVNCACACHDEELTDEDELDDEDDENDEDEEDEFDYDED